MKDLILEQMYEWSSSYYIKYFRKNNPWKITTPELFLYPQESLGFQLYNFHLEYNLEMKPNLEEHDIIHVLTNTGISVANEVALQYYLLGNGKKSPYSLLAISTGTIFIQTNSKNSGIITKKAGMHISSTILIFRTCCCSLSPKFNLPLI